MSRCTKISFPVSGASVRIIARCFLHCRLTCHAFVSTGQFSGSGIIWIGSRKQKFCRLYMILTKAVPFGKCCGRDSGILRKPVHRDGFWHPVLASGSRVPHCCASEPTLRVRCWERAAPARACLVPQIDSSIVELNEWRTLNLSFSGNDQLNGMCLCRSVACFH